MAGIWTMGEILVEMMRPRAEMSLRQVGEFLGPFPSGAPAIFIDTVARLGHKAGIIGGVGADDFGRCVVDRLEQDGVDCRFIREYPGLATAVAFVTYFADGSRKFLYHIDRTPAVMAEYPGGDAIETPSFFHIMGCSLMANEQFRAQILRAALDLSARGARISFDPNIRAELLRGSSLSEMIEPVLQHCSVLLPGAAELALISGEDQAEEGVKWLFTRYPIEQIVLKRGKQGCSVYTRAGDCFHVPAYPVEEVDPTGAGDSFDAAYLCGLLDDRPLETCARMASAAGALNAAAFGPMEGRISREAVARLIGSQP